MPLCRRVLCHPYVAAVLLVVGLAGGRLDAAVTKVACVGDSITAGSGSSNAATKSYPAVLQTLLGANYQVGNYGHSGATLLQSGDLPYWTVAEFAACDAFAPDIVVIMLGTNDSKPQNWAYKALFARDYGLLIDHYRTLASHPLVFCCTDCPVYGAGNYGITSPVVQNEVIPLIVQTATTKGAPMIGVNAAMSGFPQYFPDNVHPNDAGYALLAQTVYGPIHLPSPVTGLSASAVTAVRIDLTWTDNTNNETGIKILRAPALAGPYTLIATIPANTVTYSDRGLATNTRYFYRVITTNAIGDAAAVAANAMTPNAIPAAPSDLVAAMTTSSSEILLTWTDASDNEVGFKIERAAALAGPYVLIATTETDAVSFTDTGLTASTQYFYRVSATNSSGDSATVSADAVTAAVAPSAPGGLRATTISATQIDLAWTDASNNETGFRIERKIGLTGTYAVVAIAAADAVLFSDTSVAIGTTYIYRIGAVNGTSAVAYTNEAAAATPTGVAAASSDSSSGRCGNGGGIAGLIVVLAACLRLRPVARSGRGRDASGG